MLTYHQHVLHPAYYNHNRNYNHNNNTPALPPPLYYLHRNPPPPLHHPETRSHAPSTPLRPAITATASLDSAPCIAHGCCHASARVLRKGLCPA